MTNLRIFLPVLIGAAAAVCFAQPNRVLSRIDNARKVTLAGHVVPMANAANDAGPVETSFPLSLTLLLKPTVAQQASLEQLLQDQQNPASASYHKWLTPEQYADQFGVSSGDTSQIVAWLQTQGFTVDPVSRSRTFITFAATAGQVQASFGAAIHHYTVNGKSHYANATNPTVPQALASIVAGFRGLHDFHPRAHSIHAPTPHWTNPPDSGGTPHAMAPDDFAAIYDITPLYSAGTNGTGQSIAIVGQSALYSSGSDITAFWTQFGITGAKLTPRLINPRENPGVVEGDVEESVLDTEWSGAVARDANIVFVYSLDVWDSAQYAVDNDVAPVLSMSYGQCELFYLGILPSNRQLVQQANAEGITWLAAAGDAGAADCDGGSVVAEGGLGVDAPGSIPEVTSMGGTTFNDGSGSYWNSGNTPTEQSAKGYIPESVWNESAENGGILAGGGGASMFFSQPSWQTSTSGMPQDGFRHVPDLSFNSSVYHVPYYVYCVQCEGSDNGVQYFGGTSAATPTMAGVVALLNQSLKQSGLGNINPTIYRLGQTAPTAFHDVTTGNNIVACAYGSPGCNNGEEGYSATTGYDSASGFGSVDVANLVRQWSTAVATGSLVVPSIDQNPVYQTNPGQWTFQLTLTEEAGISTTLTGFTINGVSYSSQIAAIFGTPAIPARQSISGSYTLSLTSVPANETFGFSGVDSTGMQWSTALTIPFQGPQAQLAVGGASNAASYQQVYAPGMLMAVFGTGLGTLAQSAGTIPLPEFMAGFEGYICPISCETGINYPVPLYYVGPNQVNLQIPYEVSGAVDLNLNNPYTTIDYYFTVSTVAPGIFTFQNGLINPSSTGSPGQTVFMYITGEGRVSPALADGTSPAPGTPISQLPKPRQTVTVTVGGIPAGTTSTLPFIGIPWGLVGVTQINFTIPPNVPSGKQPVVVTVGTTPTPPAYIMIQ